MPEIKREFKSILLGRLEEPTPLIQAIVGPRQIGKTTGVRDVFSDWSGPKIFESADNFEALTVEWLPTHWNRAAALGSGTLLVIDEIQKVPRWSEALKLLFDRDRTLNLKVVILGSASFNIQRNLSESLTGRYELIPVPHWTFSELSEGFGFNFENYLTYGGYPGAARMIDDVLRWRDYVRGSIVETVLTKDLVDIAEIRNPALLRQVFSLAMAHPAQELSFQKMVGQLADKGALATIKGYLELLEGAHLLRLLYKYSPSTLTTRTSSPKILPLAPALIHSVVDPQQMVSDPTWRGRVFEAAIGSYLSFVADDLWYWREGKAEVDFVMKIRDRLFAIEVKSGALGTLSGLTSFTDRFPGSVPLVIDWGKGMQLLSLKNPSEIRRRPDILLEL